MTAHPEDFYTHEEYEAARSVNILDYLKDNGYELKRADRHNYMLKVHDSLKISKDGHKWFWYSGLLFEPGEAAQHNH